MIESWSKIIDNNFISAETMTAPEMVVTIKDIDFKECFDNQSQKKIDKQSVVFEECKPLVLNKTNARELKRLFSPNEDKPQNAIGKKVILYTEKVRAFGKVTDAIRIKEYSETKCEECGSVILPASGKTVEQLVEISQRNCNGKTLCIDCMKKFKEAQGNE